MSGSLAPVIELPVNRYVCTFCSSELPQRSLSWRAHSPGVPDDFTCPLCGVGKEWLLEL